MTAGVEPSTPGPQTSESPVGGAGDALQPITSAPRSLATPSEEEEEEELGNSSDQTRPGRRSQPITRLRFLLPELQAGQEQEAEPPRQEVPCVDDSSQQEDTDGTLITCTTSLKPRPLS